MKTKKFDKKLTLNKKTIVDLKNEELNSVKGGQHSVVVPCGTMLSLCCMTPDYPCF
jgi:natural product precursor